MRRIVSTLLEDFRDLGLVESPPPNAAPTPEMFLDAAVQTIKSHNVQRWAATGNNRAHFIKLAQKAMAKKMTPDMFGAYIVTQAMG